MNDVETRLRATLHAVAEATGTEQISAYVEAPAPRSHRPFALLATAAAAVAVVGAAVALRPSGEQAVRPAAPPASAVAGPEGGRLLLEGTIGTERWALYGAERLPGFEAAPPGDDTPCFALPTDGRREHTPRGCGFDGGRAGDSFGFSQLGPVLAGGGDVLVFGVLDAEVDHVIVEWQGTKQQHRVVPVVDPAHPDGARYLAVAVPRAERTVQVRMQAADGRVVDVQDIRVDGAVGG
ncbi:MAG TPA: hypothetical protein VM938_00355 [Acidimicrobiales bacterium]|nr:hypothetical protein [Acidimicrobiales bacterium]